MTETPESENNKSTSSTGQDSTPAEGSGVNIPPIQPPRTEQLNVGEMGQQDPNLLEVEWGNDKSDELLKGKTKPVPGGHPSTTSPPNPSQPSTPPISNEKFKFGIQVLVMVIDFILSNVLAKIAGDGEKASQYTADTEGKKNFEEALCMLLETKKDFMPTWLIVLLAFASAWGFQVMAAIQLRVKKGKPVTEKRESPNEPLKAGLFIGTDGKVYRRYNNGSVRPAQFNPDGSEKIIGQPARRRAA